MKEQNKMKKLMIAAAIVCAAAFAQAASYTWNMNGGSVWSSGSTDYDSVAEGTKAYFVFVDAYSQDALVADFKNGTIEMDKLEAAGVGVMSEDGDIKDTVATSSYTTDKQAYFAILENGNLFISSEASAGYDAMTSMPVNFEDQDAMSDLNVTPFQNAADGYGTAGWYQTVPEPTSGLLLLLGVAGLALRRRRA